MKTFFFVGALAVIAQTALSMPSEDVQVEEQPFGLTDAEIREILEHAVDLGAALHDPSMFGIFKAIFTKQFQKPSLKLILKKTLVKNQAMMPILFPAIMKFKVSFIFVTFCEIKMNNCRIRTGVESRYRTQKSNRPSNCHQSCRTQDCR